MEREQIKKALQKIANHFKKKLIKGDFKFIKANKYRALIEIDGFKFYVWIGNGDYSYDFYEVGSLFSDFLKLNDDERKKGWKVIKKHLKDVEKNTILQKIKQLENELKKIKDE